MISLLSDKDLIFLDISSKFSKHILLKTLTSGFNSTQDLKEISF